MVIVTVIEYFGWVLGLGPKPAALARLDSSFPTQIDTILSQTSPITFLFNSKSEPLFSIPRYYRQRRLLRIASINTRQPALNIGKE